MRVLHLIDSLSASGGAENGLVREILAMPRHEHRVMLLYDINELGVRLTDSRIQVETAGLAPGSGNRRFLTAVGPVRKVIADFRPDVVQTSLFLGNMVGQIAAGRSGVPVVSNLVLSGDRDSLRLYQPGAGTRRAEFLRRIAGFAARRWGTRFRALTQEVKVSNAQLLGIEERLITVIPRGIALEPSTDPPPRETLGLPEGPLVVSVGRLAAQKNHVDLIRAMARVKGSVPEARLAILGRDGEAAHAVRAEITLQGLGESVVLVGHSSRVPDYLAHAAIFAFPSLMEGLGTAVLEAMGAGLAVVAYDIPAVREASNDGRLARLVPPGDVDGLADEILAELESPTDIGSRAREWVASERSLTRVASEIEALFEEARVVAGH